MVRVSLSLRAPASSLVELGCWDSLYGVFGIRGAEGSGCWLKAAFSMIWLSAPPWLRGSSTIGLSCEQGQEL